MANEDLAAFSLYRLKLEAANLGGEERALRSDIAKVGSELPQLLTSAKVTSAATGASGLLNMGTFIAAAITPLSMIATVASFGLLYVSGKQCFTEAARLAARREDLQQKTERLRAIEARLAEIQRLARERRRSGRRRGR